MISNQITRTRQVPRKRPGASQIPYPTVALLQLYSNFVLQVADPCGVAGGSTQAQGLGGDFNTTVFAKFGDKGSEVLPYYPSGTVWKRGGVGKTAWFIRANHGGGCK